MSLTRRAFLQGSAWGVAGALGAFGFVGCAPVTPSENSANASSPTAEQEQNDIDLTDAEEANYDLVVIGSGASGMCAAIEASQAGAKVLILEKTETFGGLSNYSRRICATETDDQKKLGITVSTDTAIKYLIQHSGYSANGPMVRKIVESSGPTIAWLQENGAPCTPAFGNINATIEDWQGVGSYDLGEDKMKGMQAVFENLGGTLMLKTPAVKILTDDNVAVCGVAAQKEDGRHLKVTSKGVILAAGSYTAGIESFKEITDTPFVVQEAPVVNEGDGIRMGVELGSTIWCPVPAYHRTIITNFEGDSPSDHALTPLGDEPNFTLFHKSPLVAWVNREGIRFANEMAVGSNINWAEAPLSQGGVYFELFDQAQVDDYVKNGTPVPTIQGAPNDFYHQGIWDERTDYPLNIVGLKSGPAPDLQKALDDAANSGQICKAETIADLANAMGADPETLQATIDTYNEFVSEKNDKEFFKDAEYLVYPIATAPFYCIRAQTNVEGGLAGGTFVNENFQLLNAETGHPIPNVYAVGANAGGMYGTNTYPEWLGLTLGFAINSGRIAAQHFAEKLL